MDTKLLEAARLGDVSELHSMLQADPLVLERVGLVPFAETPLHIASLAGKTQFVKEIVRLNPSFAWDLNRDGFSPLHIASASGHMEILRVLLGRFGKDLCFIRDSDGRTPLHYAAIKGRISAAEELLSECSECLKEVTAEGDTALHLAVKNKQVEVLKALVGKLGDNRELLHARNEDGFTISQLAKATNQLQVLDLMDGKYRSKDAVSATEGPLSPKSIAPQGQGAERINTTSQGSFRHSLYKLLRPKVIYDQNTLGVVATLIATVTYQAGLSPPQTLWKENMKMDYKCHPQFSLGSPPNHCSTPLFLVFMCFNTIGFFSAFLVLISIKTGPLAQTLINLSIFSVLYAYGLLLFAMSQDTVSFLILLGGAVVELTGAVYLGLSIKQYERHIKREHRPVSDPSQG